MINNYKQTKEAVLKVYNDFLPILNTVKNDKETTYDRSLIQLEKQAVNIGKDKFLLMVVGEAKSGKSTFINAYLGEEILPMDVKQCTSAIVEIKYGSRFILNATYADDTVKQIDDETEIKEFLRKNAALDDEYRDIPVSVINIELLMNKKDKKILESEIRDLLNGIKSENIYNLSVEEYEAKVRDYIRKKQPVWRSIVKKIEIQYPFADKAMKGIEIVDTPGVNADGRVGDITNKYIEDANAVMFLKPIAGAALESSSFRNFLKSKSAERNKNAMFLLLTRAANEKEDDITRLCDDAIRIYQSINSKQIIPIDSKAEMFYKTVRNMYVEEMDSYITELSKEKKIDKYIGFAWLNSGKDRNEFLSSLKELSNFNVIDEALNRFAHKAQYIAMSDFLERLLNVINTITDELEERIGFEQQRMEDPIELGHKLNKIKAELEEIKLKMNKTVEDIAIKYSRTNGIIDEKAGEEIQDYNQKISNIDINNLSCMEDLEKISFQKIDKFKEFELRLQKNIVAECDKALISLSNESKIKFSSIKPDLTPEVFNEIKEKMKSEAYESKKIQEGICFKKTRSESVYSRPKFFRLVRDDIRGRISTIRNDVVTDLKLFVNNTTMQYSNELRKNANIKRSEYDEIQKKKMTAEETKKEIENFTTIINSLKPIKTTITGIKGGIDRNVQ